MRDRANDTRRRAPAAQFHQPQQPDHGCRKHNAHAKKDQQKQQTKRDNADQKGIGHTNTDNHEDPPGSEKSASSPMTSWISSWACSATFLAITTAMGSASG